MKTIFNIKHIIILSIVLLCYNCEDAKYDTMSNQIYLANITTDFAERITVEDNGSTVSIQVRSDKKVNKDTKVSVAIDEEALKRYNASHATEYAVLPDDFFELSETTVTIPNNSANTSPIGINLKPLTPELNKTGITYAVPVTITSVDNPDFSILKGQSSYIYIITPTPYADVPVMKRRNNMKITLNNDMVVVNDFTIEFLVKIDNLRQGYNNQILFTAADFSPNDGGTDGEIFTRFAADGAAGKFDKFQIKNQGKSYDAKFSFKNNIWYHIACVNNNAAGTMSIYVNGVLDSSFPNAQISTTVNSKSPRGVWFCGESGNDSYMRSNVQASEIRFWSVARTEAQVKNSMYGVNPETSGLIAYWKLNEGEGSVFNDITGNGHNAIFFDNNGAGANTWLMNQKVEVGK